MTASPTFFRESPHADLIGIDHCVMILLQAACFSGNSFPDKSILEILSHPMMMRLQALCLGLTLPILLLCTSSVLAEESLPIEDGDRFVSVGQLARVDKPGKSQRFVLLDEFGEVVASLRAAKDVSLREFVGQEVGVTARTLVDGETPILLAENVTTFGEARQVSRDDLAKQIALASHEEEILPSPILDSGPTPEAYPITDEPILGPQVVDGYYGVDVGSCGVAGCASCGGGCGDVGCTSCAACPCGLPGRFWFCGEQLIWWTDGMDTPALVTTSSAGTPRNSAGVLGLPNTDVLFGGEALFSDSRTGARFRIGKWCDQCNWIGFETDFFFLADEDQNFAACDVGQTIYARPFYNSNLDRQDSGTRAIPRRRCRFGSR